MVLIGGVSGMLLAAVLVTAEGPGVARMQPSFAAAAWPAVLRVEPDPLIEAATIIEGLAVIDPAPAGERLHEIDAAAAPPALPDPARQPAWPTVGPEASKVVASWITGSRRPLMADFTIAGLVPRLRLQPGPLVQLCALIPLFLVLLGRQRRFHETVLTIALPPHVAASRALIASH